MLLAATLIAALAVPVPDAQDRPARSPETDQTVPAPRGTRLTVNNLAGEVVVRGWDRDELRVQARHSRRARINIRTTPAGLAVSASASTGPAGAVDYEISVPTWMPVKIEGPYNFVSVEGTASDVAIETVRGDIVVKGGAGLLSAKTVEGKITIEDTRARVDAHSVNDGIAISGATGEIFAETVNGPIALTRIASGSVDAGTVNGNIAYDGTAAPKGRYRLATHNGNIVVSVPENANATFSVRVYNGEFNTSLPVKGDGDPRRGRRVTYTLGSGSAEFELESFGGAIRLRGPEARPAPRTRNED